MHRLVFGLLFACALQLTVASQPSNFTREAAIECPKGEYQTKYSDGSVQTQYLQRFWIDRYPVTNRAFREFVRATKHNTVAEHIGWSEVLCFDKSEEDLNARGSSFNVFGSIYRNRTIRAYWRAPYGRDSSIKNHLNFPVVHVSMPDARSYCTWRGGSVPSKIEWQYAAGAGSSGRRLPWDGRRSLETKANFPRQVSEVQGTTDVTSFAPQNAWGLHDMIGNVWEWVDEPYLKPGQLPPTDPRVSLNFTLKGGSYLGKHEMEGRKISIRYDKIMKENATASNIGFRCVYHDEDMFRVPPSHDT